MAYTTVLDLTKGYGQKRYTYVVFEPKMVTERMQFYSYIQVIPFHRFFINIVNSFGRST